MAINGGGGLLAETRRRSARINLLVDMIPARFYLPGECNQLLKTNATLDPARVKTTSQLVAEAAAASTATGGGSSGSGASANKKKNKKNKGAGGDGDGEKPQHDIGGASRQELREKLERRIVELREERKRAQSEGDKAKAAVKRDAAGDSAAASGQKKRKADIDAGGLGNIEAGKLLFDAKAGKLPFEATIGRKGAKVSKLRAALREEEAVNQKMAKAESEGRGEEMRKELAMKKALMRAKGEKVHDDIGKLRKTQKQLDKKKMKGKEAWTARAETERQAGEDRQDKRKQNLKQRTSKGKKKMAERNLRSGFEGKRTGLLNGEK